MNLLKMLSREQQKALIEAMLFVTTQPVTVAKFVKKLGEACRSVDVSMCRCEEKQVGANPCIRPEAETQETNPLDQLLKKQEELQNQISASDVKSILNEIQGDLATEDHGIELVCVAQGYQLRTKAAVSVHLQDDRPAAPSRLTSSSLETLAIIAYQQPVTRQRIEEVRGVDTGGVLGTLLDKNMIRVVGRSDEPGRPLIYGTSKKFLEVFGLNSLKDLPTLSDYRSLQASPQEREIEEKPAHIQIDDLVDNSWEELDASEKAVLEDLEESLKSLKKVEKEMPFLNEAPQPETDVRGDAVVETEMKVEV